MSFQLVEVFAVDGIGLALCHRGETDEVLQFLCPLRVGFKAAAQFLAQIREEIGHDAGKTGAAHFQRFQQGGGIGIEDLQVGTPDGIQLFFDLCRVAAGVLQELKYAGIGQVLQIW